MQHTCSQAAEVLSVLPSLPLTLPHPAAFSLNKIWSCSPAVWRQVQAARVESTDNVIGVSFASQFLPSMARLWADGGEVL